MYKNTENKLIISIIIIMLVSGKIGQIIGWPPSARKSWIRHWIITDNLTDKTFLWAWFVDTSILNSVHIALFLKSQKTATIVRRFNMNIKQRVSFVIIPQKHI